MSDDTVDAKEEMMDDSRVLTVSPSDRVLKTARRSTLMNGLQDKHSSKNMPPLVSLDLLGSVRSMGPLGLPVGVVLLGREYNGWAYNAKSASFSWLPAMVDASRLQNVTKCIHIE